ncbi:MAG: hypothetical protein FJ285_00875 [Planctomycetes bacterium]|nr:hypothetical protein [Planctomycetota bacterium]
MEQLRSDGRDRPRGRRLPRRQIRQQALDACETPASQRSLGSSKVFVHNSIRGGTTARAEGRTLAA